jgi:hypothetical protein
MLVVMRSRLPDGMADPKRTPSGWQSSVSLPLDDDGAFGRQCPDPACNAYFKVFNDDYALAREQRRLSCPSCGYTRDDESFHTDDQRKRIEAAAHQLARAAAHQVLADFSRDMRGRTRRLGPNVSIRYTAHESPPPTPEPLPDYVEQETLRTFACPRGHRAVVYDLLTACPYCGPDTPPRAVFDDNVEAMDRVLGIADGLPGDVRASGAYTSMLERSLGGTVAALQNLAKQIHQQAGKDRPPDNPWQNVDRLRRRWTKDFGRDPLLGLDRQTVQTLRLAMTRRDVIEHNGSVIDERYVKESGEGRVGQRLRVTRSFVDQAEAAAVLLADQLEQTAQHMSDA